MEKHQQHIKPSMTACKCFVDQAMEGYPEGHPIPYELVRTIAYVAVFKALNGCIGREKDFDLPRVEGYDTGSYTRA